MITETDYLEAKKLIADYELSNGIKPVVIKSLPLQDLIEFCERQEDFYNEEGYSEDAKKFHNAAYAFTKFWAEKTYGNVV